jgi:hypothetical protein
MMRPAGGDSWCSYLFVAWREMVVGSHGTPPSLRALVSHDASRVMQTTVAVGEQQGQQMCWTYGAFVPVCWAREQLQPLQLQVMWMEVA